MTNGPTDLVGLGYMSGKHFCWMNSPLIQGFTWVWTMIPHDHLWTRESTNAAITGPLWTKRFAKHLAFPFDLEDGRTSIGATTMTNVPAEYVAMDLAKNLVCLRQLLAVAVRPPLTANQGCANAIDTCSGSGRKLAWTEVILNINVNI